MIHQVVPSQKFNKYFSFLDGPKVSGPTTPLSLPQISKPTPHALEGTTPSPHIQVDPTCLFLSLPCTQTKKARNPVEKERELDASVFWRFAVCGAVCCSTAHAFLVPLDVVKTKMQVQQTTHTPTDRRNDSHLLKGTDTLIHSRCQQGELQPPLSPPPPCSSPQTQPLSSLKP